jgi:hypothetical protein
MSVNPDTESNLAQIGDAPKRSLDPQKDFMFGLLDVVADLAGVMIASPNVNLDANGFARMMRDRERVERAGRGDHAALPSKMLAEISEIWAKPRQLAFPPDAVVIPFPAPMRVDPDPDSAA